MDFIREHGTAQVEPLAEAHGVTPQTIRRDLNFLYEQELLQRVHGGAVVLDNRENLGYRARKHLMTEEKAAIGRRAAELVPDNTSLYINIGTTTEQVSTHLVNRQGVLVITNSLHVANLLWSSPGLEVMIANGTIRREDGGITGPGTEEFINRFKVDYAVIGCSAIDAEGEVFDYDAREVQIAQAIIRRSRSVILVADSMKFERRAPISLCDLGQVDYLVTDSNAPAALTALCRAAEVTLERVDAPVTSLREVNRGH